MKKRLIPGILLSFICVLAHSQTLDSQWLMLDGGGKSGYSTSVGNTYSSALNTQRVKLSAVLQPSLANPQMARNDIFVIFADGQYFNSRDNSATNYNPNFFLPSAGATPASTHNLGSLHSSNIVSMYLTNLYEGDDLPDNVRATNGSAENATITFSNTTSGRSITANHTIVMNKDLTLIIRNSASDGLATGDTLYTNYLIQGTGTPVTNTFFTASRVFSNKTQFSNADLDFRSDGKIVFNNITAGTPPYIFINMRPTAALQPFVNTSKATFAMKHRNGTQFFNYLEEPILAAHDPNYMQVLSTCQQSTNKKFVHYHIEFENTGSIPGSSLKISFNKQSYFNSACISEAKFFVGGVEVEGKVHAFLDHVWFVFDENVVVNTCAADPDHCSGYVEFWIKIHKRKDLTSLATELELKNPSVSFSHQEFPIEMFEDMDMVYDQNGNSKRKDPVTNCTCSCKKK